MHKVENGPSVIEQIAREAVIVPDATSCRDVADQFTSQPQLPAVVVRMVGGLGLVERTQYLTRYLTRFNRDLFQRKPIIMLMERNPLVLEWDTPADRAGLLVAPDFADAIRPVFIIVRGGECVGIGTGVDLMRMIVREAQSRVADLHHAQNQLVQAQTFASLGRLVAGVAHEINTPIGISLTAATHMRERVAELTALFTGKRLKESDFRNFTAAADEASSIVVQNIERAADLIRSFKSVAVDQTSAERRTFHLRRLIEDIVRSLSPALRSSQTTLTIEGDTNIEMDSYPGPLTQVLTNLLLNALTHAFEPEETGRLLILIRALGDDVEIVCGDNGCGIPPENAKRVFEPFFTTRRAHGGTGLGLHIVHNIVTQILGGEIVCKSSPGLGTSFLITIPRIATRVSPDSVKPRLPHSLVNGA